MSDKNVEKYLRNFQTKEQDSSFGMPPFKIWTAHNLNVKKKKKERKEKKEN